MRKAFLLLICLYPLAILAQEKAPIRLVFEGLKRTRPSTLHRILQLDKKEVSKADSSQIKQDAVEGLYNTKLFATVDGKYISKPGGQDTLYLQLVFVERWYMYIHPVLKLLDRNFNDWWVNKNHAINRITGGMLLKQRNFTGRNDLLSVSALGGAQQKAKLGYDRPSYFFNGKIGLSAMLSYERNLSLNYTSKENKLLFADSEENLETNMLAHVYSSYHFDFNNKLYLAYSWIKKSLSEEAAMLNPTYFEEGKSRQAYSLIQVGYRSDTRDVRGYARKGQIVELALRYILLSQSSHRNYPEVAIDWVRHVPIGRAFEIAMSSQMQWRKAQFRPYILNRGVGWSNHTLRTYDYYTIDGHFSFIQKNSFKYTLINSKIDWQKIPIRQFRIVPIKVVPKVFADVGYVRNEFFKDQGDFINRPLYGYGVGLDIVIYDDAVWRFEYGANHRGEAAFFINFASAIQ